MASLYLVSTPIGNLEDVTLRALRILTEVDIIACEDTRKTGSLLKRLQSRQGLGSSLNPLEKKQKLISYYEANERQRIPQLIRLLKEGKEVALVSNAGTPTISDPGFKLVRQCIEEGIRVIPIPGASAILSGLVVSGLPTDKFIFLGFLPKKQGKRQKLLKNLTSMNRFIAATVIIFLSPHRLVKELKDIQDALGNIEIVLCQELTKMHEEIRREKIKKIIEHFEKKQPKGELTVLFNTFPK